MDPHGDEMPLASSTRIMDSKAKRKRLSNRRNIYSITMILFFVVGALYFSVDASYYYSFKFVSKLSTPCPPQINTTAEEKTNILDRKLYNVLQNASTHDKTVIITNVNEAWAKKHSLMDLFMESIRKGNGTRKYLNHLVIVCVDKKSYKRCLKVHQHCYRLNTTQASGENGSNEAYFMTQSYLEIVWMKVYLLKAVLEMGFNFLFTDCDIMWLQDPFPKFFPEGDIQTSCDEFNGNSYDHGNFPNTGFNYVKSNERTIHFYKFWYASRLIHRDEPNQPVFNVVRVHPYILEEIGNKISDLKLVLEDWRSFPSLPPIQIPNDPLWSPWRVPLSCRTEYKPPEAPKEVEDQKRSSL
ncbi:hypothetical protein ACFE04_006006 [Oxalis oulophora]